MCRSMSLTIASSPVDDQACAIGFVVRRPLRLAGQPIGLGLDGEVQPARPHPRRHRRAGLQATQFECRVLGAGDQIAPDIGQFGGMGRADAAAPSASGWPSRIGTGRPARRRCVPRPATPTASGSRRRARHPCPGSWCADRDRRRRSGPRSAAARRAVRRRSRRTFAVDRHRGVIGISGDFIHLNSAASCLLVPMINGTGCERPSRASLTG